MKTVLIITGPEQIFGSGHEARMHALALALKRHKITVQKLILGEDETATLPLEFSLAILDRRDTAFPDNVLATGALRVALDNRGRGRTQASLAYDALPHHLMSDKEYRSALTAVILPGHITRLPCRAAEAKLTLYSDRASAMSTADFPPQGERLSPQQFTDAMEKAQRPACYFGQALFEAIYLGKDIRLYPITPYHHELAANLVSRSKANPTLLTAVDGSGLNLFSEAILRMLKGTKTT